MRLKLIAAFSVMSAPAFAHANAGLHLHGFGDGMLHPLTGADHILAMVAVGLWAAYCGGRALWALPLAFIAAMVFGVGLSQTGVVLPALETLIAASVLALGAVLAFGLSVPVVLGATLCAAFALVHGMAHGAEMLGDQAGLAYGLGLVITTALLHGTGIAASRFGGRAMRIAGATIALAGIAFFAL